MTLRISNERFLRLFQKSVLLTQVCLPGTLCSPLIVASIKRSKFLTTEAQC